MLAKNLDFSLFKPDLKCWKAFFIQLLEIFPSNCKIRPKCPYYAPKKLKCSYESIMLNYVLSSRVHFTGNFLIRKTTLSIPYLVD